MARDDVAGIEADQQGFGKNLRNELKNTWLRFADGYLRNSGNEFLEGFAAYLEEGYKDAEQHDYGFREPLCKTESYSAIKDMQEFEIVCSGRGIRSGHEGCAFLGRTDFNKTDFVKNYFLANRLSECAKRKTDGDFVVIDCCKIRGQDALTKKFYRFRDVPFVIFNNCELLLKHDYALCSIKLLGDAAMESLHSGLSIFRKDGKIEHFKTQSQYIFIGEKNNLSTAVEKGIRQGFGESEYNHFTVFLQFVDVFDFDRGERYYGHEVIRPGQAEGNELETFEDEWEEALSKGDGKENM